MILDDDVAVLAAEDGVAADEHAVADDDAAVVGALGVEAALIVDDHVVADADLVRMAQRDVHAEDDVAADRAEDQRIQLGAEEQAERAGHPAGHAASPARSATSGHSPGRPTTRSRYLSTFERCSSNSSCWMTVIRGSCSPRRAGAHQPHRRQLRRLADLADDVGGLVLRLVVGARHQLGQQAEGDQLHADEDQHHAEQQQRPVADRPDARTAARSPARR